MNDSAEAPVSAPVSAKVSAKGSAKVSAKVSVCILNYRRPSLLRRLILPALERYAPVDEIIISHGCAEHEFDYESEFCRIVHRRDYGEIDATYGLALRWLCWERARNEAVLSLDDDLLVSEETVAALHSAWLQDPEVVHTSIGRGLLPGFIYSRDAVWGEAPFGLTSFMMCSRELGGACLAKKHLMDDFVSEHSRPLWNGEDIFTSLVCMQGNGGRLQRVHRLPTRRISIGDDGISDDAAPVDFLSSLCGHLVMSRDKMRRLAKTHHDAYRSLFAELAAERLGLRERLEAHSRASPHAGGMAAYRARSVRRRVRHWGSLWRRRVHVRTRMRPSFYVIGGLEDDTEALFKSLASSPSVRAPQSEAHGFYVREYEADEPLHQEDKAADYLSLFPRGGWRRAAAGVVTGEQCAAYFYHLTAMQRVKFGVALGSWKCVVVLRDPAERAYAQFLRRCAAGLAPDDLDDQFNAVLDKEEWCLANGLPPLLSGLSSEGLSEMFCRPDDEGDETFKFAGYHACLAGGVYDYWLGLLRRSVDPERIFVVTSEALDRAMPELCDFLGLGAPPTATPEWAAHPKPSEASRERLQRYYDTQKDLVI